VIDSNADDGRRRARLCDDEDRAPVRRTRAGRRGGRAHERPEPRRRVRRERDADAACGRHHSARVDDEGGAGRDAPVGDGEHEAYDGNKKINIPSTRLFRKEFPQ